MKSLNIRACYRTDKGRIRRNNEDSFYSNTNLKIFIIADGMGGHIAGEIASKIAIDSISNFLKKQIEKKDVEEYKMNELLLESLVIANCKILNESMNNPCLKGMGTTAAVVVVSKKGNLYLASIGDSRVYLIDKNIKKISRLTKDHTLVEELHDKGIISTSNTKKHPLRHILSQALGLGQNIKPFIKEIKFSFDEYVLLCSDGLTEMVSDDEILNILNSTNSENLKAKCNKLVEVANTNGGLDNISVILLKNIGFN